MKVKKNRLLGISALFCSFAIGASGFMLYLFLSVCFANYRLILYIQSTMHAFIIGYFLIFVLLFNLLSVIYLVKVIANLVYDKVEVVE